MNHDEWFREFQEVLKIAKSKDGKPFMAVDRLLRKTRRAVRGSVSDWHQGEVLGYLAFLAEEAGDPKKAVAGYLRLAELYRANLQQYGHSLASALETAGSVALRSGDKHTALRVAAEVIRLRAEFPYFSKATEELVAALSEEQQEQNRLSRQSSAARRRHLRPRRK